MSALSITFMGLLHLLAIAAAFQLGRQQERPKARWPKGNLLGGGWQAWRLVYIIVVALSAALTILLPILRNTELGRMFGFGRGSGYGGGYGGGYGQMM